MKLLLHGLLAVLFCLLQGALAVAPPRDVVTITFAKTHGGKKHSIDPTKSTAHLLPSDQEHPITVYVSSVTDLTVDSQAKAGAEVLVKGTIMASTFRYTNKHWVKVGQTERMALGKKGNPNMKGTLSADRKNVEIFHMGQSLSLRLKDEM